LQFSLLTCYFASLWIIIQFYATTVFDQLDTKYTKDEYRTIGNWFIPISILGVANTPLCGYLMDKFRAGSLYVFYISNGCFIVHTMVNIWARSVNLELLSFIMWSFGRAGLFPGFFSHVANIFGFKSFGRAVGLISVIAALVGLLSILLSYITLTYWDRDYTRVNILFLIMAILGIGYPAFYHYKQRVVKPV